MPGLTRPGMPNQDRAGFLLHSGAGTLRGVVGGSYATAAGGPPLVLAVADGHGSAKHGRSDRGAEFAVSAALDVLSKLAEAPAEERADPVRREELLQRQSEVVVRDWLARVQEDLLAFPLSPDERARLAPTVPAVARQGDAPGGATIEGAGGGEERGVIAYGATLLAVVVVPEFVGFFQLGDGAIATVRAEGDSAVVFEPDEELLGNVTHSLCMRHAARHVRVRTVPSSEAPALVLLATDGYEGAFSSTQGFVDSAEEYLAPLRAPAERREVELKIGTWMREVSAAATGDDATVALLIMTPADQLDEPFEAGGDEAVESCTEVTAQGVPPVEMPAIASEPIDAMGSISVGDDVPIFVSLDEILTPHGPVEDAAAEPDSLDASQTQGESSEHSSGKDGDDLNTSGEEPKSGRFSRFMPSWYK